jgi:mannose-6-phosphate isomerase-like protein (cupin superfamily)
MPFVSAAEGLNKPFLDLNTLRARMGEPPWRAALIGTPRVRVFLVHWLPGYVTVPHHHPHAEEVFLVLEGRAVFSIGEEPEREVGPGELMLAERGVRHAIRVPANGEPLVMLGAVAPNEDVADETVE